MFKKVLCIFIALLTLMSVCTASFVTVAAEAVQSDASTDEATVDEATTDEVKIVISDEKNLPVYSVKGTVIGYVGDTDLNEKVNIKDATVIQKYMAKLTSLTEQSKALADTDGSGKVNIKDATAIQKYLASLLADTKIMCLMYETGTHSHNYIETVVAPKCTEGGYTSFSCICGEEYRENETAATGHDYATRVVKPTCVKDGYTIHDCKNCVSYFEDTKVAATGKHTFSGGKCKDCGITNADYSFDILAEYIKKNGDYASEEKAYYYPLNYTYEGDMAYLVYTTADNGIGIVYILNEGDYTDIFSLAVVRGEKDFGFFLICEDAFQSLGSMDKQKITEDTTHITDMEIYYMDDIDEETVTHYTAGFIHAVFAVFNDNYDHNNIPVSIQDLGFTKY